MTLFLLGDSHVKAMRLAYEADPGAFNVPEDGLVTGLNLMPHPKALAPFFERSEGEVRFTDAESVKRLRNITGRDAFVATEADRYLICMPYTTTVWLRLDQWRTFRPWDLATNGMHPVSEAAISAMALSHFRYLIEFVLAIKALGVGLAVIEAPPPRSDDRSASLGAETLLKLDRLARKAIDQALNDVLVIRPPAICYDERGFLREEYREPSDRHHANADYGALMLAKVLEHSQDVVSAHP